MATLGSRKLWIRLRSQGHDVARCTVERIMREQGWEGAAYGSKHRTTIQDGSHERYPDRVDRNFHVPAPNRLWVADFERHEALLNRAVVKGHRLRSVVAGRVKLRAA